VRYPSGGEWRHRHVETIEPKVSLYKEGERKRGTHSAAKWRKRKSEHTPPYTPGRGVGGGNTEEGEKRRRWRRRVRGWKEGSEVTVGGKGVRGGAIERGCRRKIRGGSYERPVWE